MSSLHSKTQRPSLLALPLCCIFVALAVLGWICPTQAFAQEALHGIPGRIPDARQLEAGEEHSAAAPRATITRPVDLAPGIRLVPPNGALEVAGVKLVGVTAENGRKLLVSLVLLATILTLAAGLRRLFRRYRDPHHRRIGFWARQIIHVGTAFLVLITLASIWFDDPVRLATALGLITAGLAFALQRVVTSVAGYLVILRGNTFNVGDRITMGGVRGDVIALGFMQTTIMEMGQPPDIADQASPAMWVRSRQYTGRIVTVTNAKIFDEPVFNYTREFPYLWEEMAIPIPFSADTALAERIITESATRHSVRVAELSEDALTELRRRYLLPRSEVRPRTYLRITDNWLEISVRFIVEDRGIREVKDKMSREILSEFGTAGIAVASATFEITGLPPLELRRSTKQPSPSHDAHENGAHQAGSALNAETVTRTV